MLSRIYADTGRVYLENQQTHWAYLESQKARLFLAGHHNINRLTMMMMMMMSGINVARRHRSSWRKRRKRNSDNNGITGVIFVVACFFQLFISTGTCWESTNLLSTDGCPPSPFPPLPDWGPINDPGISLTPTGLGVSLSYRGVLPIDDGTFDSNNNIAFKIFDSDCQVELPAEEQTTNNIANDEFVEPGASDGKEGRGEDNDSPFVIDVSASGDSANIEVEINPYVIANYENIYNEIERSGEEPNLEIRADINICVRLSLSNKDNVEVIKQETYLEFTARFWIEDAQYLIPNNDGRLLRHRLQDLQQPSINDRQRICKETWGIDIYSCTGDDNIPDNKEDPIKPADLFRLCIQPNQQALDDLVTLDIATISLDYIGGNTAAVVQVGVKESMPDSALTTIDCNQETNLCVIETILFRTLFGSGDDSAAVNPLNIQGSASLLSDLYGNNNPISVELQLDSSVVDTGRGAGYEISSSGIHARFKTSFVILMLLMPLISFH